MKIQLKKSNLKPILNVFSKIKRNNSAELFESILFKIENGIMSMLYTNIELSAIGKLKVDAEDTTFAIARDLFSFSVNKHSEDIFLTIQEKIYLDSAKGRTVLKKVNPMGHPSIVPSYKGKRVLVNCKELKRIVPFCETMESQFNGVRFEFSKNRIAATDRHTIRYAKHEFNEPKLGSVTAPLTLCELAANTFEQCYIQFDNKNVSMFADNIMITDFLIKEIFPPYLVHFSKNETKDIVVNKKQLIDAINYTKLPNAHQLFITVNGQEATIQCNVDDDNVAMTKIPVKNPSDVQIDQSFDLTLIEKSVHTESGEEILLNLNKFGIQFEKCVICKSK